jgi:hypothetical protein
MMARLSLLWASVHRARVLRVLVMSSAALLLGGVLLSFSSWRAASAAQTADSERAALQVAATEIESIRMPGAELASREAAVWQLRGRGFTSPADRVAWVERVTAAARAEQPLRYKVELGAEIELPVPLEVQAWYDTRGLAAPRHVTNELVLELEGLHEVELQRLLALARNAGGAEVRLERCALERRADRMGLDARCVLRRHALLAPASNEAGTAVEQST